MKGIRLIVLELSNNLDIDSIKNVSPKAWISAMASFEQDMKKGAWDTLNLIIRMISA